MKIKISYIPEEEEQVTADMTVLIKNHPSAKVRKSDKHPPYKCIYLTTRTPQKPKK